MGVILDTKKSIDLNRFKIFPLAKPEIGTLGLIKRVLEILPEEDEYLDMLSEISLYDFTTVRIKRAQKSTLRKLVHMLREKYETVRNFVSHGHLFITLFLNAGIKIKNFQIIPYPKIVAPGIEETFDLAVVSVSGARANLIEVYRLTTTTPTSILLNILGKCEAFFRRSEKLLVSGLERNAIFTLVIATNMRLYRIFTYSTNHYVVVKGIEKYADIEYTFNSLVKLTQERPRY